MDSNHGPWQTFWNKDLLDARIKQLLGKVGSDEFQQLLKDQDCQAIFDAGVQERWTKVVFGKALPLLALYSDQKGNVLEFLHIRLKDVLEGEDLSCWLRIYQSLFLTLSPDEFLRRRKEITGGTECQTGVSRKACMICDIVLVCILGGKAESSFQHGTSADGFLGIVNLKVEQPFFQAAFLKTKETGPWRVRTHYEDWRLLKMVYESWYAFHFKLSGPNPELAQGYLSAQLYAYQPKDIIPNQDRTKKSWATEFEVSTALVHAATSSAPDDNSYASSVLQVTTSTEAPSLKQVIAPRTFISTPKEIAAPPKSDCKRGDAANEQPQLLPDPGLSEGGALLGAVAAGPAKVVRSSDITSRETVFGREKTPDDELIDAFWDVTTWQFAEFDGMNPFVQQSWPEQGEDDVDGVENDGEDGEGDSDSFALERLRLPRMIQEELARSIEHDEWLRVRNLRRVSEFHPGPNEPGPKSQIFEEPDSERPVPKSQRAAAREEVPTRLAQTQARALAACKDGVHELVGLGSEHAARITLPGARALQSERALAAAAQHAVAPPDACNGAALLVCDALAYMRSEAGVPSAETATRMSAEGLDVGASGDGGLGPSSGQELGPFGEGLGPCGENLGPFGLGAVVGQNKRARGEAAAEAGCVRARKEARRAGGSGGAGVGRDGEGGCK
eukprot:772297-Rhodomonas_salina.1